ncbi:REST corepressor isoform X1 [Drosophila kikkawai]|uniref:LOW QUALITY PROTEIN: REST corepressor n=1 Tax=Drosophila kikkawai TaxID=30033 RepID=A0A6P4J161_DROKI|nr:REST corepressor isoform X1 [Drosophila kikkawai]XP_041630805.1 REST corepressor isoform X1 [Drosophila kikkawai]
MVLAERNTTDVVRNGRRSRGPSPNTHTTGSGGGGVPNSGSLAGSGGGAGGGGGNSANASSNDKAATAVPGAGTPESSDDDNSTKRNGKTKAKQSEYEEKIRVGRDYQAVCPPLVPEVERRPELMNERALLVWSPTKEIPDLKLEEYISVAKEKYGYNGEQALGMLFWHKHDLERAVMDLANFTPFPDEWTIEDKVLFEQAFQFHGKSFHRIRQMLPDKSIASLVKYYYSWKKTRHRSSAMDRQEKAIKAAVKEGSENGSEVGSNEESDTDDKKGQSSNGDIASASGSITTTPTTISNNTSNIANNNNNNNNNNNTNSNASNSGENNNNNNNHGGAGSNSSSNNTSSNDLDTDQQLGIIYAQGDEVLGFGTSFTEGATTNGANNNNNNNNDGSAGNSNDRIVVGGFCKTCHVVCHVLFDSPLGRMCKSCHTHWRRTGNRRPISGPESNAPRRSTHNSAAAADRSKRKPPKGMYINHDDLTALASCENPIQYLSEGDRKITSLMAEIQKNRQMMEQLDKECDAINVEEVATKSSVANAETAAVQPRISARWLPDEIQVALLAIREYGKNYPMIAKLVTTKTEAHVRTFFVNNRRRYNLDQIVKEYEAGKSEESGAEEQTEAAVVEGGGAAAAAVTAGAATANAAVDTPAVVAAATARKPSTEASNNGVDPSPESQAKKEELKKPEPAKSAGTEATSVTVANAASTPASSSSSSSGTASASALASATASTATVSSSAAPGSVAGATGSKTSTATITITDESDTATNSSSDVVTAGATTAAAAAATSSPTSASAAPAPKEETTATSTATAAATGGAGASPAVANSSIKRDSSAMSTAADQQPPAKKIALSGSTVELLGK